MTEIDEWVEKHRARDRAEAAAKDAEWQREVRRDAASICAGCGRRWFTVRVAAGGSLPVWIPEARGYFHHVCWQRKQEGR